MKKFVNFTRIDSTKKTISPFTKTFFAEQEPNTVLGLPEKTILPKQAFFNRKKRVKIRAFYSKNKKLLKKPTSVLCTISGGQDSILTFFLLLHIMETFQVIYCQHLWQIKNFFSSRLIFQLCYLVKIPYTLILPQNLVITENESREWRKKTFSRFSYMEHIITSITGHTETDTLEKNLNNLFRGTSPSGLESFDFLNSEKTVGLLFSTRNVNRCGFINLQKKIKKLQPNFAANRNDKKTPQTKNQIGRTINNGPRILWYTEPSGKGKERLVFKTYKKKLTRKSFHNFSNYSLSITRFCSEIANDHTNEIFGKGQVFKFFYLTKVLSKKQTTDLSSQIKSCSFCLSNQFFRRQIKLMTPLKNVSRLSVSKLVNLYKLPVFVDVTNFCSSFSRNKIRHQLLPFIRSLVHPNVEYLFNNFFNILAEENKDVEKEFNEFCYIYKLLNLTSKETTCLVGGLNKSIILSSVDRKRTIILKSNLSQKNLSHKSKDGQVNNFSQKQFIKIVSTFQAKCLIQKLFFDYKNLNLNYLQNFKLNNF